MDQKYEPNVEQVREIISKRPGAWDRFIGTLSFRLTKVDKVNKAIQEGMRNTTQSYKNWLVESKGKWSSTHMPELNDDEVLFENNTLGVWSNSLNKPLDNSILSGIWVNSIVTHHSNELHKILNYHPVYLFEEIETFHTRWLQGETLVQKDNPQASQQGQNPKINGQKPLRTEQNKGAARQWKLDIIKQYRKGREWMDSFNDVLGSLLDLDGYISEVRESSLMSDVINTTMAGIWVGFRESSWAEPVASVVGNSIPVLGDIRDLLTHPSEYQLTSSSKSRIETAMTAGPDYLKDVITSINGDTERE